MAFDFTKHQWLTLIIMGTADFFNAICVSLQAPFFPQEAEKKGSTATEYGLVFGIFELVVFIVSPIYGHYLKKIGAKHLFHAGIFTTGISAIVFGLLDRIPGHFLFISAAFVVRIVEALGNAAFLTASFSIIATEFPNNVGTTFAALETCFGLGLIVGPMVGGFLYSVGGYFLPFVILGSALFSVALMTLCILPKNSASMEEHDQNHGILKVIQIPGVLVCSLGIIGTSASIGFISATLEPHIREFDLSPFLVGVVFVINGGVYAGSAPIWGCLVDRGIKQKYISLIGSIFIILAFIMVGPTNWIPLSTSINYVIIGLILHGLGIGALLVSSFSDALDTAIRNGFLDNIATYGVVSGLWTSTFAFGAFMGPTVSGYLYDKIGFRASTNFIIVVHVIVALIYISFMLFYREPAQKLYKEIPTTENLMKFNRENLIRTSHSIGASNTSISSGRSDRMAMPISRGCAMNNLMMCSSNNSYSSKGGHWARMEEVAQALITESEGYGSFDRRNFDDYREAIP